MILLVGIHPVQQEHLLFGLDSGFAVGQFDDTFRLDGISGIHRHLVLFADLKEWSEEEKKKEIEARKRDLTLKIDELMISINSIKDIFEKQQKQSDLLLSQIENINKRIISITSNPFYQEYQARSGKEEITSSSLELWNDTLKERQKKVAALKEQIDSDKKQLFELKLEGTNIDKEVEIMGYLEKEKSHFDVLSDQWIKL